MQCTIGTCSMPNADVYITYVSYAVYNWYLFHAQCRCVYNLCILCSVQLVLVPCPMLAKKSLMISADKHATSVFCTIMSLDIS